MPQHVDQQLVSFLQHKALGIRIDSVRATTAANSGHPTTCLSVADIVAVLLGHVLRYDYNEPINELNDRFILSKGHAVPVFYAALHQFGLISDEELLSLRKIDSVFEGHPTPRLRFNEAATGSLGQGLSIGLGMAINAQRKKLGYVTYVVLGDGECAEGSVWEAAALAGKNSTPGLVAIVDANRLAQSGESLDAHNIDTYANRWASFGWETLIIDGNDIGMTLQALSFAKTYTQGPVAIIAKTFKGFGLDDWQDKNGYHGKPLTAVEAEAAIAHLNKRFSDATHYSGKQFALAKPAVGRVPSPSVVPHPVAANIAMVMPTGKTMATRKAFGIALAQLTKDVSNVWTVDADVQNSTFTDMAGAAAPERFVQCYIAEQNMISVATGLTQRGNITFAATFAAFFSRCFDQIRMASIGRVPLRLCGSHSGCSIGEDGPSQMGLEDMSMLRAVPRSVVLYPSDGVSAYKLVYAMAAYNDGVSYMKTTRAVTPLLYDAHEVFPIGGCKVLVSSPTDKLCIVAAGITVHEALKAHKLLAEKGIAVSAIDAYSVKPLDATTIIQMANAAGGMILTVEDHYIEGGLGETVAHAVARDGIRVHSLGVHEVMRSGTPEALMALAEIDATAIVKKVEELLSAK
ncbi:transketolase [Candidatus Dependentiae bacterium]|nr:transketolase [Candidatus Dependentiae bacterium]